MEVVLVRTPVALVARPLFRDEVRDERGQAVATFRSLRECPAREIFVEGMVTVCT